MRALQIERNGQRIVVAGANHATMIAADVSALIHESGATVDVRGMTENDGIASHISWIELAPISYDDRITFRFVNLDAEFLSPPLEDISTDSPQFMAEQEEYLEYLQNNPPEISELERKQPKATLSLLLPAQNRVTATFENGRELMSCRFLWNKWRPDQCRVSLSSCSREEALAKTDGKDFFQGTLKLGESCMVHLQCQVSDALL